MIIESLFPTPVGVYTLDKDITKEEINFISSFEKRNNAHNKTSNDTNVLNAKEMESIKKSCQAGLNEYFEKVFSPVSDCALSITQSWFNYTTKGQSHHEHKHPNSFVSAVLYIAGDESQDRIYFTKPPLGSFQVSPKEFNYWNSESWWLPMEKNTMILFPSTLSHYVANVEHDEERITMSFNTFPLGVLGSKNQLTELHIKEVG